MKIPRPYLKTASAILSNIAAALLFGLFAIRDIWVLIGNIVYAIICVILVIKLEEMLEEKNND